MDFGFTEEQEKLRQEFRTLFNKWQKEGTVDPEQTSLLGQPHSPMFYREVAERGFIGAAFPKEYGGSELGWQTLTLFQEEAAYLRAPISLSLSGTVLNFLGELIAE